MTVTTPAKRTISVTIAGAALTLIDPATMPASWRVDVIGAVNDCLTGRIVLNSFNGATVVLGDAANLRPYWGALIVDIDGLDGPDGNEGYHAPKFHREQTTPIDRLRALDASGPDSYRSIARRLLAALSDRATLPILADLLAGTN